MTKHNTARLAGVAMLKAGTATLHEVAKLAGVSNQHVSRWIQKETGLKRTYTFDWQTKRAEYLVRTWHKQLAKFEQKP